MLTRREFFTQTVAAGVSAATSTQVAVAAEDTGTGRTISPTKNHRVTGDSRAVSLIKSVARRDETTLRLGGVGDNYHMSWAADDRQYVSVCDGLGWVKNPKGVYNSRLFAIDGDPQNATFHDVPTYPDLIPAKDAPRYYNFGTLALDGHIYQYLSTFDHGLNRADGTAWPELRFIGAKLICSPDDGRTWCNQDGSMPVEWESWERRSPETMVFYNEPQDAFSLLTVLQMGRNYEANKDGYIYVYAPNGSTDGTMNQLVMFRVPKSHILTRGAYEFFAGVRPNGDPTWVRDVDARAPVHTFPRGWVNKTLHPYAWQPSVVYNAPLGLYLMANWGMGCSPDGLWFGKSSYLGFYTAVHPWGPWTQIHEETAWMPDNDLKARAYQPQISPKWIANDGKSFWLVWTDFQNKSQEAFHRLTEEATRSSDPATDLRIASKLSPLMPYYSFNTQRVDLLT